MEKSSPCWQPFRTWPCAAAGRNQAGISQLTETKHPDAPEMLVEFVGWECWTLGMLRMLGCRYVGDFDVLSFWVLER